MCLFHIYFVVSGTNFSYGLTSKQNMAHIYVGTVQGPSPKTSNLSRVEEVSPPSTLESFLQWSGLQRGWPGIHWIEEKGGGQYWGRTKKRFWHNSIFSCNHRLWESFSVCSVEIVSLRYGWTGPTDKFQKCFGNPKHFQSVLEIQNTFKVFCQNIFSGPPGGNVNPGWNKPKRNAPIAANTCSKNCWTATN